MLRSTATPPLAPLDPPAPRPARPPRGLLVLLGCAILILLVLSLDTDTPDASSANAHRNHLEAVLKIRTAELESTRKELASIREEGRRRLVKEKQKRLAAEAEVGQLKAQINQVKSADALKATREANLAKQRFIEEVEKGCRSTQAVFKKRWALGWVLYVPNSGEHTVRVLFPEDKNRIERALERIGAGDDVPYVSLLRYLGEC